MSLLFQIEGKAVFPNAETLLISPFKEIWERDGSPGKEIAIQEFAYVEFMTSMLKSNPYREYQEEKKDAVIRQDIITVEGWQPDDFVLSAINKVVGWQEEGSLSYTYWMANKLAAEKMIDFFNNFDFSDVNPKTLNPLYKPRDITSAIMDAEKTLTTLNTLKKKVDEEVFESSRNKGDKVISPFAIPTGQNRT